MKGGYYTGEGTGPQLRVTKTSEPFTFSIPQWDRVTFNPDTVDLDNFDKAHSTRGHVVRAFFWLMRLWP